MLETFVGPPERVNPVSDVSSTYADQPHTAIVVVVDVLVDVVVVLVVDVVPFGCEQSYTDYECKQNILLLIQI